MWHKELEDLHNKKSFYCSDRVNWFYHTEPQRHVDNRVKTYQLVLFLPKILKIIFCLLTIFNFPTKVMYWPRGKVWGGSSSLNAMVYVRGHALDFDR